MFDHMSRTDDRIIDVTNDVKWIGILDYDIRTFDIVMHTDFGTTYNSYFINAEKKAIIEVAKEKYYIVPNSSILMLLRDEGLFE